MLTFFVGSLCALSLCGRPMNAARSCRSALPNTQTVIEGDPDCGGMRAPCLFLRAISHSGQDFIAGQMLALTTLFVGDAHRPEASCSIFSIWRCCLDHMQLRRLPRSCCRVCSITKRRWNIHDDGSSALRNSTICTITKGVQI